MAHSADCQIGFIIFICTWLLGRLYKNRIAYFFEANEDLNWIFISTEILLSGPFKSAGVLGRGAYLANLHKILVPFVFVIFIILFWFLSCWLKKENNISFIYKKIKKNDFFSLYTLHIFKSQYHFYAEHFEDDCSTRLSCSSAGWRSWVTTFYFSFCNLNILPCLLLHIPKNVFGTEHDPPKFTFTDFYFFFFYQTTMKVNISIHS